MGREVIRQSKADGDMQPEGLLFGIPWWFSRSKVIVAIIALVASLLLVLALLMWTLPQRAQVDWLSRAMRVVVQGSGLAFLAHIRQVHPGRTPEVWEQVLTPYAGLVVDRLHVLVPIGALGSVAAFVAFRRILQTMLRSVGCLQNRSESLAPSGARKRTVVAAAVTVIVFGTIAQLPYFVSPFSGDEIGQFIDTNSGFPGPLNTMMGTNHVLQAVLARIAAGVFGQSPLSHRLPSVICGLLGSVFMFLWAVDRFGPVQAWVLSLLVVSIPLWAEQTSLNRGYGALFLFTMLSLYLVGRLDQTEDTRKGRSLCLWFIAAIFLGTLSHFFFLLWIVALVVFFLLPARAAGSGHQGHLNVWRPALFFWSVVVAAVVSLIYVPMVPLAIYMQATTAPPLVSWLSFEGSMFAYEYGWRQEPMVATVLAVSTFTLAGVGLYCSPRCRVARLEQFLLGLPVVIALLLRPIYLPPRFFIYLVPIVFRFALCGFAYLFCVDRLGAVLSLTLRIAVPLLLAGAFFLFWVFRGGMAVLPLADYQSAAKFLDTRLQSAEKLLVAGAPLFVLEFFIDKDRLIAVKDSDALPPAGTARYLIYSRSRDGFARLTARSLPKWVGDREPVALFRGLNFDVEVFDLAL